jgi:hypothetical protein
MVDLPFRRSYGGAELEYRRLVPTLARWSRRNLHDFVDGFRRTDVHLGQVRGVSSVSEPYSLINDLGAEFK